MDGGDTIGSHGVGSIATAFARGGVKCMLASEVCAGGVGKRG